MRGRLADVGQYLIAMRNERWRIARSLQIVDQQLTEFGLVFHD